MFDPRSFSLGDMVAVSSAIRRVTHGAHCMEEAALAAISYLHENLRESDTGIRSLALARVFTTQPFGGLPLDVAQIVLDESAETPPDPDVRCLSLIATVGEREEWSDRRRSSGHQAIPLPSVDAIARAPMISALLSELGVEPGAVVMPGAAQDAIAEVARANFGVFHVADAAGSPSVPAQDFVEETGISSVLGFGGVFPGGRVYAAVLFSRTPIPETTAELFRTVAVSLRLALLPHLGHVFCGQQEPEPAVEIDAIDERAVALDQLVEVLEASVARQDTELQATLDELRASEKRLREEANVVETLHRVGTSLTGELEFDRIVQIATDAATELTEAHFGALFYNVADERGEMFSLYTLSGVPRSAFDRFPMPRNTAIFEPTFRGLAVVRSGDITKDPRFGRNAPYFGMPAGHLPVRSYLAVPVVSRSGQVLAGLFFGHPRKNHFNERHERFAVGIASQTAVAIDNARLYEHERDVALTLQQALLPRKRAPGTALETAFRYRPGAEGEHVGGDLVDVIELRDGRSALVIGDVVGRGVRAAAVMGQIRAAIRAYAMLDLPPVKVLENLDALLPLIADDQFVTCFYGVLDVDDGKLRWASAGHLPPLVVRGESASYASERGGLPVYADEIQERTEHMLDLEPGDVLVLYTDGLVESRTRPLDHGLEWLLARAVEACDGDDLESACDAILARLDHGEHSDDVALLLVRLASTPARASELSVLDSQHGSIG